MIRLAVLSVNSDSLFSLSTSFCRIKTMLFGIFVNAFVSSISHYYTFTQLALPNTKGKF